MLCFFEQGNFKGRISAQFDRQIPEITSSIDGKI